MKKWIVTISCSLIIVVAGITLHYTKRPISQGAVEGNTSQAAEQKAGGHAHGGAPSAKPTTAPPKSEPAPKQEEAPTVEISMDKQQLIGVKTVAASRQPIEKVIRTVGRIDYDERNLTTVNTKVEGWIEKLYVNFTGIYVKKGEPLADIYSPELWATQQEFINLARWAKKTAKRNEGKTVKAAPGNDSENLAAMLSKDAESIVDAARQRLKLWDISDEQIRKIEESEKPIRTLTIYSPVSGYVLQKYALQGMKVMAGEKLLDVTDLSTVWVFADIYEFELPLIKVGETARIKLSYFPGREITSRIDWVSPALSPETRTVRARFSVPNIGGQLKPQMFTDVELKISLGSRLAVPDEAVIDTGLRKVVYVDKGNGLFEPREIATGLRTDKLVEVTDGLKAGDRIASSANFLIDSEAKLKSVAPLPRKTPAAKQTPGQPGKSEQQSQPPVQHRH